MLVFDRLAMALSASGGWDVRDPLLVFNRLAMALSVSGGCDVLALVVIIPDGDTDDVRRTMTTRFRDDDSLLDSTFVPILPPRSVPSLVECFTIANHKWSLSLWSKRRW